MIPENDVVISETVTRKTEVIMLRSRQRRMLDWFDLPGLKYVALGKTTKWIDVDDETVNDMNPPTPSDTADFIEELIGLQRIQWQRYAKPIMNPTTEQKNDYDNVVYYKGIYYQTTQDRAFALENGFTCIMCYMLADRDTLWPVDVQFRQVGLYVEVKATTDQYVSAERFYNLSQSERGYLEVKSNRRPISRQANQSEEFFILLSF